MRPFSLARRFPRRALQAPQDSRHRALVCRAAVCWRSKRQPSRTRSSSASARARSSSRLFSRASSSAKALSARSARASSSRRARWLSGEAPSSSRNAAQPEKTSRSDSIMRRTTRQRSGRWVTGRGSPMERLICLRRASAASSSSRACDKAAGFSSTRWFAPLSMAIWPARPSIAAARMRERC